MHPSAVHSAQTAGAKGAQLLGSPTFGPKAARAACHAGQAAAVTAGHVRPRGGAGADAGSSVWQEVAKSALS